MKLSEFTKRMEDELAIIDISIGKEKAEKFYKYMNLLVEWNERVNLTAIIEPDEVITKHFIDSLTIFKYIKEKGKIIDVGTGAGFPGIPIKILQENISCTLLDSLNKRLLFLNQVIENLNLQNIETVHGRAEELGIIKEYREKYDIAISRAVAKLNILLEYISPYVKVGGTCICMKGPNVELELQESKKTIEVLGLQIDQIEKIILPQTNIVRNIVVFKKTKATPEGYPRQNGKIRKSPI